jgi:hypothetical protein
VAGLCGHDNEALGCTELVEFLYRLRNCQLVKDIAAWGFVRPVSEELANLCYAAFSFFAFRLFAARGARVLGGFRAEGILTPQDKHFTDLSCFNYSQVLDGRESCSGAK